jgi:transcriptional regulator with XRE-family HTH domain
MRSGELIREARLRAGLTQYELAERSRRERSVIARWERGTVAPSVETLIELVRVCGFNLSLELEPYEAGGDKRLLKNARLTPERRVQRFLQADSKTDRSA